MPASRIEVKDPDLTITDSSGVTQRAESIPETWIANSLKKNNLKYKYQVSTRGGRSAPGGIVVDFIVYSGITTALEYAGAYWHKGSRSSQEALKWSFLAREFDRLIVFSDEPMPWLGAWAATDVITDQETSDQAIRKHFV